MSRQTKGGLAVKGKRAERPLKRYRVTFYKKHYIHEEYIASSIEQATSLAWADAPKDSWVDKVEEI